MTILISLLLIVEVLSAFLLIVVILAQKSKDQGLGMAFGGGMGESLFGSRAGNVLTRITITLAVVFMITTILLGILFAKGQGRRGGSVMDRVPAPAPAAAPLQAPMADPMGGELQMGDEPIPMTLPAATPDQPIMLEVNEDGELVPSVLIEESAVLEENAVPEVVVEDSVSDEMAAPASEAPASAEAEAAPQATGEPVEE
ncbi:MAG: preprotein translocase subunit SecG [Verrucomicrobiota bacterium]|jgi:preprotein translocase subunit SecG|nr:preprotein translocase subunit SecG [Verrucomicrobiota bacterium]